MAARISMDTDTWWHLRAGQWIVEHRAVPRVDPFSYTRFGQPWQYPGWLVEVPVYEIYLLFGPGGLNVWTALMVTLAFAFIWHTLSGGPLLRAFVIVLAGATTGVYWAARPYLVTFVLAAVYLWILEGFRWKHDEHAARRLWWLPVLMVIWANSHGGFIVGFILWGVYFVYELLKWFMEWLKNTPTFLNKGIHVNAEGGIFPLRSRVSRLALIGFLMIIAVCINPYGPIMLLYPFKTVGISALQEYIQEWQSPNFHLISVQPFAWLLLLTLGIVGVSRKRLALTDLLLVVGFAYMGLLAGRNIALFGLVAPMVLTRHAEPMVGSLQKMLGLRMNYHLPPNRIQSILNPLIVILLILAVIAKVWLVYPASVNEKVFEDNLPVKAVEFLRENHPPGRLFNPYNWGGYLVWALPEYPVFVDGRTDLYNDEIIGEWLKVVKVEPGWQDTLVKYGVSIVMTENGSGLDRALKGNPGWSEVYQDSKAVVYQK
jgi:hypothetical protein